MEAEKAENAASQAEPKKKTSSGLEENLAGALCYVFGFITGIIFLVIEKENKFVRYHAMHSIMISIVYFALSIVLGMIPILGWVLGLLLMPVAFVVWVMCLYKAYQGKWFELPWIGKFAREQVEKIS
jgi:uncharacterized membrane protein